jgi:predicted nucleic acid-binding protein
MSACLLDTSALIAAGRGALIDAIRDREWLVSSMTVAELNLGVLRARTTGERQRMMATYMLAARVESVPFDDTTARTYAELFAWSQSIGWSPSVPDAIIAATAATNALTLVTFDHHFDRLAGFDGLDVDLLETH